MSKVGPFVVGGVVGATAALFLAPRTGEQTRALVSEKVNAVCGECTDFVESTGVKPNTAVFQDVAANAQNIAKDVQAKVTGAPQTEAQPEAQVEAQPEVEADNDDLRAKIEAARERIAAQVVKNAEESQAQVASPIEAEPVEAPAEEPAAETAAE